MVKKRIFDYTWREKWVRPYESLYSILEKFKAANVLTGQEANNILFYSSKTSYVKTKLSYDSENYIFRSMPFKMDYELHCESFDVFKNIERVLHTRIRYCPECIRLGYHSILHQLIFLGNCPIHNHELLFLCDCEDTYAVARVKQLEPYQCKCGKKLNVPKTWEGIMGLWSEPLSFRAVKHSNIKEIKILDFYNFHSNPRKCVTSNLSDEMKQVLKDIFFCGYTEITPIFKIKNESSIKDSVIVPIKMHEYFVQKYGIEEYKRHLFLPQRQYHMQLTEKLTQQYNMELLSAVFLLKEILKKKRIEQIYPVSVSYGILETKDFSSYYEFLNYELKHVCVDARNFIYHILLNDRMEQIKDYMFTSGLVSSSDGVIPMKDCFSNFIVIIDKENSILIYK